MAKYFNYSNILLIKNAIKVLEYIKINNHTIKLEKNK